MKIWASLYLMIWLAFLGFLVDIVDLTFMVELHVLLGVIILALAYYNSSRLRATDAPARIKRITRATAALATAEPFIGIPLYLTHRIGFEIPFVGIVEFIHLAIALAIITQAASAATSYDMWEEKEFIQAPSMNGDTAEVKQTRRHM